MTLGVRHGGYPQTRPYITVDLEEIRQTMEQWRRLETELQSNQIFARPNTKEFSHANFFGGSDFSLSEARGAFESLLGFISFSKR